MISAEAKDAVIMKRLKDTVLKHANSDPNNPLSPSQVSFIQQQLQLAFPVFQTPTHPAYSAMILHAIKEMDEDVGSNEESISKFIKANYEGLPWAHSIYLSHHLRKLCENGEIVCNSTSNCYTMPDWAVTHEGGRRKKQRKRRLVRKRKEGVSKDQEGSSFEEKMVEDNGDLNGVQEEGIEEVEGSGNLNGFEEEHTEEFCRSRTKPRRRSLVFHEESDEAGRSAVDGGEQNLSIERHNDLLAQEDGVGDTSDANMMPLSNECVEESRVTLITPTLSNCKDTTDAQESGLKGGNMLVQGKIREDDLNEKQPTQIFVRKRKGFVNKDEKGNTGGEVLKLSGNMTGLQEEGVEEFLRTTRSRSLVVWEGNDEVGRTTIDEAKQNLAAERRDEVLAREDGDDDTSNATKFISAPAECVEESPVSIVAPSVFNIGGDNDPGLAGKESVLNENMLKIMPFEGNTSTVNAEINPFTDATDRMLICGLASISEQKQPVRKHCPKKKVES
ncbi:HMG-Y-related protein A [Bienertia sinuspersici]